jgi:hypothetical protein
MKVANKKGRKEKNKPLDWRNGKIKIVLGSKNV